MACTHYLVHTKEFGHHTNLFAPLQALRTLPSDCRNFPSPDIQQQESYSTAFSTVLLYLVICIQVSGFLWFIANVFLALNEIPLLACTSLLIHLPIISSCMSGAKLSLKELVCSEVIKLLGLEFSSFSCS